MNKIFLTLILSIALVTAFVPKNANATEDQFKNVFVTAMYVTAAGALLGLSILAWDGDTQKKDKAFDRIAKGASLGFITGIFFGAYLNFYPAFATNDGGNMHLGVPAIQTSFARVEGKLAPSFTAELVHLTF